LVTGISVAGAVVTKWMEVVFYGWENVVIPMICLAKPTMHKNQGIAVISPFKYMNLMSAQIDVTA
jgi:hypothetical protein